MSNRSLRPRQKRRCRRGVIILALILAMLGTSFSLERQAFTATLPVEYDLILHSPSASLSCSLFPQARAFQAEGDPSLAVGVSFLQPQYSVLGQGFDDFFAFSQDQLERPAAEVTNLAMSWIQEHDREKFFLWLHYYDPHYDYNPPAPYDTLFYEGDPYAPNHHSMDRVPDGRYWAAGIPHDVTDIEYPIAMYDGEIAYTDGQIGELVGLLQSLGLYDNTLIQVPLLVEQSTQPSPKELDTLLKELGY
ncbi:MAG: sulfatase-like hydrolase/transferase [Chloroflexia bacterium]|nr:sulfatase-like hydrolase/transferase [Chloroflexia bacterium]